MQVDTGLDRARCEAVLEKLIDLRLVRHIESYYEVTHDFVARKIINELADSEEREFKRFRELLSSQAAAYSTTRGTLTNEELLMLYKHRQRIIPNDQELRLLLASWVRGEGPGIYWLLNVPPAKLTDLLAAEEHGQGFTGDEQAKVVLLKRKLGEQPFADGDFSSFRNYQLSWELTRLISEIPHALPDELLRYSLRHRREEVREATIQAIAEQTKAGKLTWISRLRVSASQANFQAYLQLVGMRDIPISNQITASRAQLEFSQLQRLERAATSREAHEQYRRLARLRPPKRVRLFGKALLLLKTGCLCNLLRARERVSREAYSISLEAVRSQVTTAEFKMLLNTYSALAVKPSGQTERRSDDVNAWAIANAISRVSKAEHLPLLRRAIETLRFSPAIRPLILASLRHGALKDFELLLERVSHADEKVELWNHIQIGHEAASLMRRTCTRMPKGLKLCFNRKEFWTYILPKERRKTTAKDLLPIKTADNRALFVRLVGYGMIGVASTRHTTTLVRLSTHEYSQLARAAATRLADLLGENALKVLANEIDVRLRTRNLDPFAYALRYAEMRVFGLV
ncbi:MAG: hypothetical protein ACLQUR_17770 [Limisphaerales bacterium]